MEESCGYRTGCRWNYTPPFDVAHSIARGSTGISTIGISISSIIMPS